MRIPTALMALAFIAGMTLLVPSCRRINEFSPVGSDVIPPIDNINTFDTSLSVQVFNDTFGLATDSFRSITSDQHFLGLIQNDPLFGKTDARLFLELKPSFFGKYPFDRRDSVKIDSAVLVLNFLRGYGDSTVPQTFSVYELNQAFKADSFYLLRVEPFTYTNQLSIPGQVHIPSTFNDSVKAFRDTSINQIRIRLDTNFARRMFNYDTTDAYRTDSSFRTWFKGLAVRSTGGGNALIGLNMQSAINKIAFYYKYPKPGGGGDTTVVTYFSWYEGSQTANFVKRDYSGTPVAAAAGQTIQAPVVYIQQTPGTFARVLIPGLPGLSNRVVHRAELIMEQLYDPSDEQFTPPGELFVDAYDPTITDPYKFRTIPYSFDFNSSIGFNNQSFGTEPVTGRDPMGQAIKTWRFNLTRYVQYIVTGQQASYELRLHAPMSIQGKTKLQGTSREDFDIFPGTFINPTIATGRVRLGGGNHPTQRMRLRLVYSRL
jgi:hypothetical protein